MRILIVEDEIMLMTALRDEFNKHDCVVDMAPDGTTALEMLKKFSRYDVMVLDLMLPNLNGIEVLKSAKNSAATKDMPVVVLTNLSDDKTISAIIAAGGTDYLVKADYTLKEVVDKIIEISSRPRFKR